MFWDCSPAGAAQLDVKFAKVAAHLQTMGIAPGGGIDLQAYPGGVHPQAVERNGGRHVGIGREQTRASRADPSKYLRFAHRIEVDQLLRRAAAPAGRALLA